MATLIIGDTTENAIMNLIFRAVNWSFYADATATTPQTNIGISLHTADPGDAGSATTSEVTTGAYPGYTRVNVARTTGGWSAAAAGSISPAANIDFPACTAGGTNPVITWFMTAASNATPPTGAQVQLWRGDIAPTITVNNGVTPRLTTATTLSID